MRSLCTGFATVRNNTIDVQDDRQNTSHWLKVFFSLFFLQSINRNIQPSKKRNYVTFIIKINCRSYVWDARKLKTIFGCLMCMKNIKCTWKIMCQNCCVHVNLLCFISNFLKIPFFRCKTSDFCVQMAQHLIRRHKPVLTSVT